jgi:alkanesulfonate monooxygenase SsuD/methylene tetrahydromethanopterin reductase-like flavin-dependent oxidoreductase (luciferase family)
VTHFGLVKVQDAKVYSLPQTPPMVLGAAISNETAEWVAGWADGGVTTAKTPEQAQEWMEAFQRGGGADKLKVTQVLIAYDPDEEKARREVWEQWRTNVHGNFAQADLYSPSIFDAVSQQVRPADMDKTARISSSLDKFIEWFAGDIDAGFDRIYIYSGTNNQEQFLRDFGRHVLPALRDHAARRERAHATNGHEQPVTIRQPVAQAAAHESQPEGQRRGQQTTALAPGRGAGTSALQADVPLPRDE